jgi:glycosyltransferase involved in cell wall biosynthesis
MMNDRQQGSWAFISWWPHSRRSEAFSRTLGGTLHCIYHIGQRRRYLAPLKYALQSIDTLRVLFKERPQAVHAQNPPFVCSLVVDLYCRITGAHFVIDHHSAAFSPVWEWALVLQKYTARRALTNIVTNEYWADIIHSWNAHAIVMGDPFLELPPGTGFPVSDGFNVAFICTFSADEPVDAVLEAAAQLPGVHLYITGDNRHLPRSFVVGQPANVTLTGFLPDDEYIGLLRSVDAILVLTKRDHTLQLGGCEAVAVGQPLITSDWPFLRQFFPRGTIHVENDPGSIREGILAMQEERERFRDEMEWFRTTARREWDVQLAQLTEIVAEAIRR